MTSITGKILGATLLAAIAGGAHATTVNIATDGSWNQFDVDNTTSLSGGLEWIDNVTGPAIPQYTGDGSALV